MPALLRHYLLFPPQVTTGQGTHTTIKINQHPYRAVTNTIQASNNVYPPPAAEPSPRPP